jgi:hypothetical protein
VLIDIALRPSDERYVALQVLRAFDTTRNTGQLLGGVQFERQVLRRGSCHSATSGHSITLPLWSLSHSATLSRSHSVTVPLS